MWMIYCRADSNYRESVLGDIQHRSVGDIHAILQGVDKRNAKVSHYSHSFLFQVRKDRDRRKIRC